MYSLNSFKLEEGLRAINEKSADIFQWVIDEFTADHAWLEISKEEFEEQTNNAVLWTKEGERQFNDRLYKWDEKRFYVREYRSNYAPIKGWMRRTMQKVHAQAKYSQKDIERIAKVIRLSVEQV